MNDMDKQRAEGEKGRAWETPAMRMVGTIGEVLQQGGGKLSPSTFDPGDSRKPPGQDNNP